MRIYYETIKIKQILNLCDGWYHRCYQATTNFFRSSFHTTKKYHSNIMPITDAIDNFQLMISGKNTGLPSFINHPLSSSQALNSAPDKRKGGDGNP